MIRLFSMCLAGIALASCSTTSTSNSAPIAQPASADAIKGVHHVGITVSDIDETVAFYASAVPYEVVDRRKIAAASLPEDILEKRTGEIEIALIKTPTVFLQLIDIDPQSSAPENRRPVIGPGYTHICFQSHADVPKYDRFKEIGLDMLSRGDTAVDLGGYGVTYAYGFDRDGTMIEMEQLDSAIIEMQRAEGAQRVDNPAWIRHLANVPGDKAKMVEFYTTVLGYGPRRELEPMSRKTIDDIVDIDDIVVSASWFDTANFELEFWHYLEPKTPHVFTKRMLDEIGYNSLVFEVTDLAGTIDRLQPQGVQFAGEVFELNGWTIRFARDPEGNLLAFQERSSAPTDHSIDVLTWK